MIRWRRGALAFSALLLAGLVATSAARGEWSELRTLLPFAALFLIYVGVSGQAFRQGWRAAVTRYDTLLEGRLDPQAHAQLSAVMHGSAPRSPEELADLETDSIRRSMSTSRIGPDDVARAYRSPDGNQHSSRRARGR